MALGVTWSLPQERHTYSKEFFEDTICKAMGGRVAEIIVFGKLNSGAANDLEQATGIARRMVREWGMSERVGPMAWSRPAAGVPRRRPDVEPARVQRRHRQAARRGDLADPHRPGERAPKDLLTRHRRGLELIAEALLEHETIDGPEVAKLIQQGMAESGQPADDIVAH
jgi:cell division protease FtsH